MTISFEWPDTVVDKAGNIMDDPLIPNGEYRVEVTGITKKDTKNGSGTYLDVRFLISSGKEQNKAFYIKFFVKHMTSQQKLKVDVKNLQNLQRALLGRTTTNAGEMIGKRCIVDLGTQYGKDKDDGSKWPDMNVILSSRAIPSASTDYPASPSQVPASFNADEASFDDAIPF